MMKKIYKNFLYGALSVCLMTSMTSCADYLDKEEESSVSKEDAFKNFTNFQGFVEEIYNCIPNKESCQWCTTFNWGEDEIMNTGQGDSHFTREMDLGNYKAWSTNGQHWLYRDGSEPTANNKYQHSLWPHAWYCIRKANMGLENLDKMTESTQDERNLIAGQLYFFRAWWHEELMQYWGGIPYIESVIGASDPMKLPRMTYAECVEKCAADFKKAAELLPTDWDLLQIGRTTLGKNELRLTKIAALGYLGKVLLWGASPLMTNGAQTGAIQNGATYKYNTELCKRAADALGELLNIVEKGDSQFGLAEFNFENIYDHEKAKDASSCYSEIFFTVGQGWKQPGSVEAIFRGPATEVNGTPWNFAKLWGTKLANVVSHDAVIHQPTANYVNYYGMANGLPLDDPASGFDPTQPFKDRDPRFYHDIVFDGFRYMNGTVGEDRAVYTYCQLYTGGNIRDAAQGSRTGYYVQKLVPHTCNEIDLAYDYPKNPAGYLPYMRLADIYLMYAEACAAIDGATGKSSTFSKTAEGAINTLRARCGAGSVANSYTADKNKFMDEVRRERAVELSFEGFRFNDLQRWLLLTEYPYNIKTSQEFTRVENDDFYKENDPKDAKVAGWNEKLILQRQYTVKHYWFPFLDNDTYLYKEFVQNPGW